MLFWLIEITNCSNTHRIRQLQSWTALCPPGYELDTWRRTASRSPGPRTDRCPPSGEAIRYWAPPWGKSLYNCHYILYICIYIYLYYIFVYLYIVYYILYICVFRGNNALRSCTIYIEQYYIFMFNYNRNN